MVRNPALLADLWDDQAMLGAHLLLPNACVQPTGAYGSGITSMPDVSNFGDGPIVLNPPIGARDLKGNLLPGYGKEPFPKVCYQGPAPFLPQVGVAMKLSKDLGIGFGFFPPDTDAMTQWGNRDGTVNTPNGKRPNPIRFEGAAGSLLSTSFFSMLGAVGYRVADWIRIGAGFQWNVVAYQSRSWTAYAPGQLDPHSNVRTDTFGRDLFIPGLVASVQIKPIDSLDIALGVRWSDRVKSDAKLDITPGAFSTGKVYEYLDPTNQKQFIGTSIPQTTNNVRVFISAPPIYVPQLSLGLRYADRLKPLSKDRDKAHALAGGVVEDHMLTERWDIELDGVYYLNSAFDQTLLKAGPDATVTLPQLGADGTVSPSAPFKVGKCPVALDADTKACPSATRILKFPNGGKNQMTVRLGGDYNVLPGMLALRAGVSYETDGQKIQLLEVMNYMLSRVGVHGGFTLRVAGKTDISFGFAHFIQKQVKLQINDSASIYQSRYRTAEYHFQPGLGVKDKDGVAVAAKNGFDGIAQVETPNGAVARTQLDPPGPDFINAGTYNFNLDVVSLAFTQHF